MRFETALLALLLAGPAVQGFMQRPSFSCNTIHNNDVVTSTQLQLKPFEEQQRNVAAALTAATIFFSAGTTGMVVPVHEAFAAPASPAPTVVVTKAASEDPLSALKANIVAARGDIDGATRALKLAGVDFDKAKAVEGKAKGIVRNEEKRLGERKSAFLYANDSYTNAKKKDPNARNLAQLQDRVTKEKASCQIVEADLAKAKDGQVGAAKQLATASSVKIEKEKALVAANKAVVAAETKLKTATEKLAKDQKVKAEKRKVEEKKSAEKSKKDKQKKKEQNAKDAKTAGEKKKKQDSDAVVAAQKAAEKKVKDQAKAKIDTAKRQKETLKKAQENEAARVKKRSQEFALITSEKKVKELEAKKTSAKSLSGKDLKKLESDLSVAQKELKKAQQEVKK